MPEFVPFSIREALNSLGRELFPSEWTWEEHEARRGLISEDEWFRIKDLTPARGGNSSGSGPRRQSMQSPAAKPAPHLSDDPSDPLYQKEYRAGKRHRNAHDRLRQLLEAGEHEAAILDPWTGRLHRASDLRCASQRRGAKSRSYLQALKLGLRLNGIASIIAPIPDRPRKMHKRTYQRLCRRLEKHEQKLRNSRRFMSRETDYSVLVAK